ncbi:ParA family protein [Clostridium perfringens]|uniref:ParA family protein n=1 Tax=Clostridium perfringens TaxID=1502 RepID=UPI00016BCA7D|nr:AAA family ATPase [Clostridium perfringens]EDT78094.1 chromosome partitioning ATPase, ParA family [Clostridium perfringens NCTC 8239]EHK2428217.1 AAA family ATPase [Clostridium perfringens]ELC8384425.1 AAA family ATPase [Clostridium perfringens]MDK0902559.1 AAA family ATPase [Clostridium perfringens]
MGHVISVINMKGGVGKTTLSVGMADYLSENGHSVLLIDADPQFNSTQAMLDTYKMKGYEDLESEKNYYNVEVLPNKRTIYKLFTLQTNMTHMYSTPEADDLIINLKENLDILCGDLSLVLVNKVSDHTFVKRIRNFIEDNSLKEKYEYIIIDCPPTLTIYTDSALMASDYYLIPNRIDRYSIVGIDSLQQAVTNLIREERISLKCIGLVYTMVTDSIKQQQIRTDFESKKSVNDIEIFSSFMAVNNHIQYGKQGPLPTKYTSKEDIEAISLELIHKINNDKRS